VIKLIIFDAGGVLYMPAGQEIVDEAVKRFLEKHGVIDFYESQSEVWPRFDKLAAVGKISVREAHEGWLEACGLPRELADEWADTIRNEVWRKSRRTPGINRLLRKLKDDYTLVVLSDSIENKQEKIDQLKVVGVDHTAFAEIFTSHDIGARKPSRKSYTTVLRKFMVKPDEALYVGDSREEVEGAKKIGMATIGFKCEGGDYNIKKLNEINKILNAEA
jgi:HAD superfamily hydrolase (TIGR01509 family)